MPLLEILIGIILRHPLPRSLVPNVLEQPASPSAKQPLAFGRDGGADRRQADVSLACRRSRRRGARHAGPAPARQRRSAAADAQASQEARLCTEAVGDRQAALVCLGVAPSTWHLEGLVRS